MKDIITTTSFLKKFCPKMHQTVRTVSIGTDYVLGFMTVTLGQIDELSKPGTQTIPGKSFDDRYLTLITIAQTRAASKSIAPITKSTIGPADPFVLQPPVIVSALRHTPESQIDVQIPDKFFNAQSVSFFASENTKLLAQTIPAMMSTTATMKQANADQ